MAVTFTGASYLSTTSMPAGLNQNSAAFTVSVWIYVTAYGGSVITNQSPLGGSAVVTGDMDGSNQFPDYIGPSLWSFTEQRQYFEISVGSLAQERYVAGPDPMALNTWHHVAMTFDGANIVGYVNGTSYATNVGAVPSTAIAWKRLLIGGFDGHAQDVVLFNRTLSSDEILRLYTCRLPRGDRSGIVGHWPLFSDSPTLDWSGNGRTLSSTGSVAATDIGPPVTWAGEGAKIFVHITSAPVSTTYIRQSAGQLIEVRTVNVSTGSSDADKVPSLNASGYLDASIVNSTVTSAGAGSSGKLVALGGSGLIDATCLPAGTPDTQTITASEALAASDLVNIDTATGQARKANASNGRAAHGFVLSAVSASASATVYLSGRLTGLAGLTTGGSYFLSGTTAGAATATAPTTTGQLWQPVGTAVSATEIAFIQEPAVTL